MQSILRFKTLDEAIERANNTTYGLAAGILTHNLENALVFSNAVEAGSVWVNCFLAVTCQAPVCSHYYFSFFFFFYLPLFILFLLKFSVNYQFGGYKQSGLGRECGDDVLELYTETKTVTIKLPINHWNILQYKHSHFTIHTYNLT